MAEPILGIWDGHDSGAAVIQDDKILFAINEERLTRRKLEVHFPERSIQMALDYLKISPGDIRRAAISTFDFAKTLSRLQPSFKEEYYQIRRRKKIPGLWSSLTKQLKYKLTEFGPHPFWERVGRYVVGKKLKDLGFGDIKIHFTPHHRAHAVSAAFCSGFDPCLALTLDGIGDGLSGTVNVFREGTLKTMSEISGRDSLGIFFEHVTNCLNMRELEDEGKVMALANYAYPIADEKNPFLDFFQVKGLQVMARFETLRMYKEVKKVLWRYPSEEAAYMAQRTMEVKIMELITNAVSATGVRKIALAGGVASNIKVNMLIKNHPDVEACFIFPHMGDGGLALGAAMDLNDRMNHVRRYELEDVYFGPEYSGQDIETALKDAGIKYQRSSDIVTEAALAVKRGEIVLWFQGRMEIGPRALGARSILALPNSEDIKDRLNLRLKKRVWYQPFCPSMLEEDARELLEQYHDRPNRFMTMGFMVKPDKKALIRGVINVDGSCRPQIVKKDESKFSRLLQKIKDLTGLGVVLNTSFNLHGDPIVCSPQDAIKTYLATGIDHLMIGDFWVR